MSNWIRNSTKRRRVGPPKPRSQRTRVFNAQGIVSNARSVETERMRQIEFDLEHARGANERVETFQPLKRGARSLESEESTRDRGTLPPKEDEPSKALTALDLLQRKDPITRRARILQTVDLVGLNTRRSWKPKKPPLQIPSTTPPLDKSREIINRTDLSLCRTLHSVDSRDGSESESLVQETIVAPARVLTPAHALTLASQQPILTTPFSQDEILSMDLTLSQSRMGSGSYEQENASFSDLSDSLGHVTNATVGHNSSLVDDTDTDSMAANDYTSQSDYLRATPQAEDGAWDEGQCSGEEDMYQQGDVIPLLYPIIYNRLGFPIIDRPLEYRLRLSGDRSGVGWPLETWRGDETDLLADETIDIGVALGSDGLSSSTLWEETTTNSRGPYSRCLSDVDHSAPSYRFYAPREGPQFSSTFAMVGPPNTAPEKEYVQEEGVAPFAYQLADDDGAILWGGAPEDDVEEIRCSPPSEIVTLIHQEPGQTTESYQVQYFEPAFDDSQDPTEAKPEDLEAEEAMKAEGTISEDESSPESQVRSAHEPFRGFVLAPDIFWD